MLNEPHREKTCLRGFRQSEFLTSLLFKETSMKNEISGAFQKANNKGADQTAETDTEQSDWPRSYCVVFPVEFSSSFLARSESGGKMTHYFI